MQQHWSATCDAADDLDILAPNIVCTKVAAKKSEFLGLLPAAACAHNRFRFHHQGFNIVLACGPKHVLSHCGAIVQQYVQ